MTSVVAMAWSPHAGATCRFRASACPPTFTLADSRLDAVHLTDQTESPGFGLTELSGAVGASGGRRELT